jgi:hypothetical protein
MDADLVHYEPGAKTRLDGGEHFVDNQSHTIPQVFKTFDMLNDDGSKPIISGSVSNYLPGVTGIRYPKNIGGGGRLEKSRCCLYVIFTMAPHP